MRKALPYVAASPVGVGWDILTCMPSKTRRGARRPIAGAEIHFRLVSASKPLLIIPVRVNDVGPFRFIVDTGASMTLLGDALAERVGLVRGRSHDGYSATGKFPVSVANVDSIAVGRRRQVRVRVAVGDLSTVSRVTGMRIDGILGYNFLKKYRLVVDYRRGTIELT